MKKTILFALMVVGLTVSFFVGITVSQEPKTVFIKSPRLKGTVKAVLAYPIDRNAKSQRLRTEVLQLFQQRLQTMNEEELTTKKADLQKELSEVETNAKLQQAQKLLQEILKTAPNSQAAKQARKMLGTRRGSEEGGDAEADPAAKATEEADALDQ